MVTMTAYEVVVTEHARRTELANRMGWLKQAASESAKVQRRRRPGNATGAMGIVATVANLLAAFVR